MTDTSFGGGWIHSRDYSLWVNIQTGQWEKYSEHGEPLVFGVVMNDE